MQLNNNESELTKKSSKERERERFGKRDKWEEAREKEKEEQTSRR